MTSRLPSLLCFALGAGGALHRMSPHSHSKLVPFQEPRAKNPTESSMESISTSPHRPPKLALCRAMGCAARACASMGIGLQHLEGSCGSAVSYAASVARSCVLEGDGCIASTNYPSNYPNDDSCTIQVDSDNTRQIRVDAFDTESGWDKLVVNGVEYDGTSGPAGVVPTSDMQWTSVSWLGCCGLLVKALHNHLNSCLSCFVRHT